MTDWHSEQRCPKPHPTMSCWKDKDHDDPCITVVSIMGERCGMTLDSNKNFIDFDNLPQDIRARVHRINVQK